VKFKVSSDGRSLRSVTLIGGTDCSDFTKVLLQAKPTSIKISTKGVVRFEDQNLLLKLRFTKPTKIVGTLTVKGFTKGARAAAAQLRPMDRPLRHRFRPMSRPLRLAPRRTPLSPAAEPPNSTPARPARTRSISRPTKTLPS
jgi:hypothetical protein